MGSERVEKNLNIVKIVEDLRNLKEMVKLTISSDKLKFKTMNAKSQYINLDSEDEYFIEM